jgi:hypothetical protein
MALLPSYHNFASMVEGRQVEVFGRTPDGPRDVCSSSSFMNLSLTTLSHNKRAVPALILQGELKVLNDETKISPSSSSIVVPRGTFSSV